FYKFYFMRLFYYILGNFSIRIPGVGSDSESEAAAAVIATMEQHLIDSGLSIGGEFDSTGLISEVSSVIINSLCPNMTGKNVDDILDVIFNLVHGAGFNEKITSDIIFELHESVVYIAKHYSVNATHFSEDVISVIVKRVVSNINGVFDAHHIKVPSI